MFVTESVRPQFGHAFSLGLYALARPFSGLTFLLTPPSASSVQAHTCLAIFVFDLILPHFQRLLPWATAYILVVHFCILALEAFNSQCILFLWMPRPPMFLQIFPNSSHWDASGFCISLVFAIILSSSTR